MVCYKMSEKYQAFFDMFDQKVKECRLDPLKIKNLKSVLCSWVD